MIKMLRLEPSTPWCQRRQIYKTDSLLNSSAARNALEITSDSYKFRTATLFLFIRRNKPSVWGIVLTKCGLKETQWINTTCQWCVALLWILTRGDKTDAIHIKGTQRKLYVLIFWRQKLINICQSAILFFQHQHKCRSGAERRVQCFCFIQLYSDTKVKGLSVFPSYHQTFDCIDFLASRQPLFPHSQHCKNQLAETWKFLIIHLLIHHSERVKFRLWCFREQGNLRVVCQTQLFNAKHDEICIICFATSASASSLSPSQKDYSWMRRFSQPILLSRTSQTRNFPQTHHWIFKSDKSLKKMQMENSRFLSI